jgi:hypothetical protein
MTNSRCLTEGVDLPAIDCVVFTDPKKSKVDIVQAAGRALRLSPGKKFGYILIPLIIPENENATEAAKDTAFEEIVATIRALATQDSRIIEYLRAVSSGTIPKGGSPVDGITKINVLTKVNEKEFNKSIQLKVWDRVAFGNWRSYADSKKYAQSLKLKNSREWFKIFKKNKLPLDINANPHMLFKNFEGWGIFLGTGFVAKQFRKYMSYQDAKKYVQSLKLKSRSEWFKYLLNNKLPAEIPNTPQNVYKKKFEGWGIFLGAMSKTIKVFTFKQMKKYVQSLNIKSKKEWESFKDIHPKAPRSVNTVYSREWKGWGDFFGTGLKRGQNYIHIYKNKSKPN